MLGASGASWVVFSAPAKDELQRTTPVARGNVEETVLASGIGFRVEKLVSGLSFIYSPTTILAAFVSSSLIGVLFGFMPARSAARLDPVVALASE